MQPEQETKPETNHATLADVAKIQEQSVLQHIAASQAFWVAVALVILVALMSWFEPTFEP